VAAAPVPQWLCDGPHHLHVCVALDAASRYLLWGRLWRIMLIYWRRCAHRWSVWGCSRRPGVVVVAGTGDQRHQIVITPHKHSAPVQMVQRLLYGVALLRVFSVVARGS
jgi:hypothetical protein